MFQVQHDRRSNLGTICEQGKMILVTDDEDRENEGDFICAAEFASTENVNFHGQPTAKGLICMPMSRVPCAQKLALSANGGAAIRTTTLRRLPYPLTMWKPQQEFPQ